MRGAVRDLGVELAAQEERVSKSAFGTSHSPRRGPSFPRRRRPSTTFEKKGRLFPRQQMNSSTVKRYLPWVVATALFMEQLDSTIVNTAVPAMAASLHVTPLSLKAVVTSYILSLAVCIPVSGWMADRFGTRRVFSIAVAIFTLSSILCGLALNVPMLVAARILQGLGAAMMMPVGRLAIIRTFPKSELLVAMNFVIIPALIGPLLGPTVGGLIVHWLSWREIFFVNVPVGLAALFIIHRYMPDYRGDTHATAGCRRAGPVRQRHGAAVLAAGNLRRARHRRNLGRHLAAARDQPAGSLRLACAPDGVSAAAPGAVSRAHLSRLGGGRLHHPPRRGRHAVSAAAAVPARPGPAGLAIGPADDADRRGRHGHEAHLDAGAGALRLPPGADREYGDDRAHHLPVLAGESGHADCADRAAGAGAGLFNSLQFSSMNSMAYADIDSPDSSMASTIASSLQQMSMSFGLACGSLITGWYLGDLPQTDQRAVTRALHYAFLTLGGLTMLSSLIVLDAASRRRRKRQQRGT